MLCFFLGSLCAMAAPSVGTLAGGEPFGCYPVTPSQSRHIARVCIEKIEVKWRIDTLGGEPLSNFGASWIAQPLLYLRGGNASGDVLSAQSAAVQRAFGDLGFSKLRMAALVRVGQGAGAARAAIAFDPGSMKKSGAGMSLSSPGSTDWDKLFMSAPKNGNACEADRGLAAKDARALLHTGVSLFAMRVCELEFSGLPELNAVLDAEKAPRSEAASMLRGVLGGSDSASSTAAGAGEAAVQAPPSGAGALAAALGGNGSGGGTTSGAGDLGLAMAEAGRRDEERRRELATAGSRLQSVSGALGNSCPCYLNGKNCRFDTDLARSGGGAGSLDRIVQGCKYWSNNASALETTARRGRNEYMSPQEAATVRNGVSTFEGTLALIRGEEGRLLQLASAESTRRSEEREAEKRRRAERLRKIEEESDRDGSSKAGRARRRAMENDDAESAAAARRSAQDVQQHFDRTNRDLGDFINQQNSQRQQTFNEARRAQQEQDNRRRESDRQRERDREQASSRQRERDSEREREQERTRERDRQRRADEERTRIAEANRHAEVDRRMQAEEARRAEEQNKARNASDYLRRLASGTRLNAKTCYGEQHVMGSLPSIQPKVVSCVDVHFRAYCPGSSAGYRGVLKNMQSMGTGCFGDTARIQPPLNCKAEDLRVEVVEARACEF